jgi:hypothetical protein
VIRLVDLAVRDFVPVKVTIRSIANEDHSRWVFRSARSSDSNGLFFKIWNPTYVRRDNILGALGAGFYDERTTPALDALVFHEGVCRGYVMRSGTPCRKLDADFFELIKHRSEETGYFNVQFSAGHTMLCDGKISLLDLEGVYPIAEYGRMEHHRAVFDNADYERHVAMLYQRSYLKLQPSSSGTERVPVCGDVTSSGERLEASLFGKFRSVAGDAWQWSRVLLRRLRPRVDLIQY